MVKPDAGAGLSAQEHPHLLVVLRSHQGRMQTSVRYAEAEHAQDGADGAVGDVLCQRDWHRTRGQGRQPDPVL